MDAISASREFPLCSSDPREPDPPEDLDASPPDALAREAFQMLLAELTAELQPVGAVERLLVRELARHAAAGETWHEALGALQRQRALHMPRLFALDGPPGDPRDTSLAAAGAGADVHLGEQHCQRRSRAFHRTLHTLLELQARRQRASSGRPPSASPDAFPTEAACEEHLRRRWEEGRQPCPHCGARRGYYLAGRRSWECGGCGRQMGLRGGTVAAESPLPLVCWFAAIRGLLADPALRTAELAERLGIRRAATVRRMAQQIRAAMASDRASALLAGLDVPAGDLAEGPASDAPGAPKKGPRLKGPAARPRGEVTLAQRRASSESLVPGTGERSPASGVPGVPQVSPRSQGGAPCTKQ